MSTFIIEMGSGNSCRNDMMRACDMVDAVRDANTLRVCFDLYFKWQLFSDMPPNKPLSADVFDCAYHHAAWEGYETSASVFSEKWLSWLLANYQVPFVKIACIPELHKLISRVPGDLRVYVSFPADPGPLPSNVYPLACVRKYPATIEDYEEAFSESQLRLGISDHTVGWDLYNKYKPDVIEKHFVDVREDDNPDAGPFAVTAKELAEVL